MYWPSGTRGQIPVGGVFFFTGCPALFDSLPSLSMCLSFGVRMSAFCMRVPGLGSMANHNQAKPVPAEMSTAHFLSHNTAGHHASCSIWKINNECQSKLNILPINSHKYCKLLCCNYKKKEKKHLQRKGSPMFLCVKKYLQFSSETYWGCC